MSLDAILKTALTGLSTNQSALRTTSNNIANVNTEGYSRQIVSLQTKTVGAQSAGVEIAEVRRIVDKFLNKELITSSAGYGYYDRQSELHDRLQTVLGNLNSSSSLDIRINELFEAFNSLSVDAASTPRRIDALSELQNFADTLDRIAEQIQLLREEADRQVQSEITVVNSALSQIHTLNGLIAQQKLQGEDPAGLEDERQRAIEKISEIIDIRAIEQSDNYIEITTAAGLTLLDKDLHEIQYNAPGQITTSVSFNSMTVHRVNSTTGVAAATGTALDTNLRSGTLRGLVDMRDKELVEIAIGLGELGAKVIDQINAIHNNNSSVPAPNALTGTNSGILATDAHGFTGMVTFAVLDADDEISSSYTLDFGAGGIVTVQDAIDAVNAGLTGATLALSNGVMSLTAAAGTDSVAIQQDSASPSSRAGRGFAHFFGMNNLLNGRAASHFETGITSAATHGFGATGTVDISFRGPGGDEAASYTLDFSATGATVGAAITDLNTAFSGYATFALDSSGKLTVTPASGYENFDMAVTADSTARGATGVTFSAFFGLGNRYRMDQAFDIQVRSDIAADPSLMALAQLDTSAGAGVPALTSGDNRGATALFALSTSNLTFDAAGDLPSLTTTLSSYTGYFLSTVSLEADRLASLRDDRETLKEDIQIRRDSAAGVDLDEELSNMIIYQNAYNAAARLITTANEMFDTLLSITN